MFNVLILFPEVQKCYVFRHGARLFVYYVFIYFQNSRNVMFSGTEPDYLFIYIYFISRSPEMLCFSGTVPEPARRFISVNGF